MWRDQNFGWVTIFLIAQLLPWSQQSLNLNGDVKKSRNENLLERNSSVSPNNWIPLQRTSEWRADELNLPVSTLSTQLLKFADVELGLSGAKSSYESLSSPKRVKNVEEEIEDLAAKISKQITSFQEALERMAASIKWNAESQPVVINDLPLCCQLQADSFQYDEYFETAISKTSACWTVPSKLKPTAFIPGPKFSQALMDNAAKLPHLKWQYFISPEGIHVEYPANSQNCKNSSLGRQTSNIPKGQSEKKLWLIQKAKDDTRLHRVVFLIQLGQSTTPVMVKAVRDIVMLLLTLLDNTDEVGIISSEPDYRRSSLLCDQMVPVTPWTRYQILNYLNFIERRFKWPAQSDAPSTAKADEEMDQASLIQSAISMACSNFSDSPRLPPSAATIIHLSSGISSDDTMNKFFHVTCPVFIETFFLKTTTPNEEEVYKKALQNVASKNIWRVLVSSISRTEPDAFALKVALKLNSKKEWWSLSDILSQFFPRENANSSQVYDFSFPHWSPTFSETVIVAKKYIFHLGQPLGLVAIEIPMLEFTQYITYFASDNICESRSYAFLIDKFGRVIAHPALGKPDKSKEMPQIQIDQVEVHAGFASIKRKLLSEGRGCQSLRLRGGKSGITYSWIALDQNYVVILAVAGDNSGCFSERSSLSLKKDFLNPKSDVQHHLLLQKSVCCYSHLISPNKAALYLAPNAFLRPVDILHSGAPLRIKSKWPLALMAYIGDNSGLLRNQNRGMRPEMKDHISWLANSVPTWKRNFFDSEWSKYIMRRYSSGAGGTFLLIFPGFSITSGYVPRLSGWFRSAIDAQGKLVFLPPTLDSQSKMPYTTMAQSVDSKIDVPFSSEKQKASIAVMGADISISFFEKVLGDLMPECRRKTMQYSADDRNNVSISVRCFLLDEAGFVIYHPSLTKHLKLLPRTHVTQLEPLSVIDVLQHGQDSHTSIPLQKRMCYKLSESSSSHSSLQRVYSLQMRPEGIQNLKHGELCSRYQIMPVPGTNLFLSVVQDWCSSSTAFCPCSKIDKLCLNCLRMEPTDCECPCECPREPNFCTSKSITDLPEDIDLCGFPDETLPMVKNDKSICDRDRGSVRDLVNIYCDGLDNPCSSILRVEECLGAWDCDWCYGKESSKEVTCMKFNQCFGYDSKSETRSLINRNSTNGNDVLLDRNVGDDEEDNQISAIPVIGVLSMFLIFIALVFYCYRHRALTNSSSQPDLHLLPLQDGPVGAAIPTPGSNRSDSDTEPDCMPHEMGVDGRNNRSVLAYAFPPRSPLGSVFGTDSDLGYSTMTPNEDSECGAALHPVVVYTDNPSHRLIDKGVSPITTMHCQSPRKGISSRSHVMLC